MQKLNIYKCLNRPNVTGSTIHRPHRSWLMAVFVCYRVMGNLEVSIPGAKFFGLADLGTGEKKNFRSDNRKQEDVDSAGEMEHPVCEQCGRRRDMYVPELQPSCHRYRKDDEGIRQRVPE